MKIHRCHQRALIGIDWHDAAKIVVSVGPWVIVFERKPVLRCAVCGKAMPDNGIDHAGIAKALRSDAVVHSGCAAEYRAGRFVANARRN